MLPVVTGGARAAIVGGGPAGLMAAEVLAEAGVKVTIFEHRASLGRKFLLAGRGGLNITHSEDVENLVDRYGSRRDELEEALASFSPDDLRAWCASLGEETFIGTSGRVFPASFKATPLLRAWLRRLDQLGVVARTRTRWLGFTDEPTSIVVQAEGHAPEQVDADIVVFAMGGASWPRVGSDGGWVEPMGSEGIETEPLAPSNCGVQVGWSDGHRERFAGTPLKNVGVWLGDTVVRGDVMVTEQGLEGGPIYAHSARLRTLLARGATEVVIDLLPDLSKSKLIERLNKRRPKQSQSTWLGKAGLDPVAISLLRESTGNAIPDNAMMAASLITGCPVAVADMMPIDRAISSAGGVRFSQLDGQFMVKARPGVYVAGEMLDWEAPTGGYLLQATFSTAVVAARAAVDRLREAGLVAIP